MIDYTFVNSLLCTHTPAKESKIVNVALNAPGIELLKLRDVLISNGIILFEDIENRAYVASIKGGFLGKNQAYQALQLAGGSIIIASFSQEGIINQRTNETCIEKIKGAVDEIIRKQ